MQGSERAQVDGGIRRAEGCSDIRLVLTASEYIEHLESITTFWVLLSYHQRDLENLWAMLANAARVEAEAHMCTFAILIILFVTAITFW